MENKYYVFVCACARVCLRLLGRVSMCLACKRVALVIQRETPINHAVKSFVAFLAPPRFSTLSHKQRDFRKNVAEHESYVFILSTNVV